MPKKVVVIHTSFVSVNDLKGLFQEILPEVRMINMVDDSLLPEVLANGGLTSGVTKRICSYAMIAESSGADLILNQCSSVGEAVDAARKMLNIPCLKIDEPMAEEAVRIGGRISVVATVKTTLDPSIRLIEKTAAEIGKKVGINRFIVEGAFDALVKEGNKEKHNALVIDCISRIEKESDVIVLAQGSMICLLPFLTHIRVPVLSSPRSGVTRIKRYLD